VRPDDLGHAVGAHRPGRGKVRTGLEDHQGVRARQLQARPHHLLGDVRQVVFPRVAHQRTTPFESPTTPSLLTTSNRTTRFCTLLASAEKVTLDSAVI